MIHTLKSPKNGFLELCLRYDLNLQCEFYIVVNNCNERGNSMKGVLKGLEPFEMLR